MSSVAVKNSVRTVSKEELIYRQSLPLRDKIDLSSERIEKWFDHWDGNVYVAFSGGKDSTVLLDIVRNKAFIPDAEKIPAVFSDTGLEFPEIRDFVKTVDNVVWARPKLTFRQVIDQYGFPVVSKEQSQFLGEIQTTKSAKLMDIRLNGNRWGKGKVSNKNKYLIDAPFKISHKCCEKLKKFPAKQYEKDTGRKAILGTRIAESNMRRVVYYKHGCNAYDLKRPMSTPLSFWTDEDILEYLRMFDIPHSKIYDMGYDRTGCMFCMYGVHRDDDPNRFQKMKGTHPKLYRYCIESLGLGDVLDFMGIDY